MADVQSNALHDSAPEAPQTGEPVEATEASIAEATMDGSDGEAQADSLTEAMPAEDAMPAEEVAIEAVIPEAIAQEPVPADPLKTEPEKAEPVKTVEAALASAVPELESTTIIPGTGPDATNAEGGGEWELLIGKVRAWLGQGKLQALWAQARNPLSLILATAALLVVLRVYAALLGAIDSLPLIPGLLELVGVIWAVRFGVPKLLQRSQREQLFGGIQQRWQSFRGRG
jgi:hypothetical protein